MPTLMRKTVSSPEMNYHKFSEIQTTIKILATIIIMKKAVSSPEMNYHEFSEI